MPTPNADRLVLAVALAAFGVMVPACTTASIASREKGCPPVCEATGAARPGVALPSMAAIYAPTPTWKSQPRGLFDTGVALGDIDADGWTDLVVSSGNDMSAQTLDLYFNHAASRDRRRAFGTLAGNPEFTTAKPNVYFGHLALGDVDKDGCLDAAVSVPFIDVDEEKKEASLGGVRVFFNRRSGNGCSGLEKSASFATETGLLSISCELADVDGDGDLDLIAAVAAEAAGKVRWPPEDWPPESEALPGAQGPWTSLYVLSKAVESTSDLEQGRARIFYNRNGRLDRNAGWRSDPPLSGADVALADFDQDGLLDLALATMHTAVYFGALDASRRPTIETRPRWQGEPGGIFSYAVEAGPGSAETGLGLFTSFTALSFRPPQPTYPFLLYRPRPDGSAVQPIWRSDDLGRGSRLLAADLDDDATLDLAAGRWSSEGTGEDGAPVLIYPGTGPATLSSTPAWRSKDAMVSQAIGAANLYTRPRLQRWSTTVSARLAGRSVLTIDRPNVHQVVGVRRSGRALSTAEFACVPGEPWLSVAAPLTAGEVVEVDFLQDDRPDLIVADWNPSGPTVVYENRR